VQCRPAGDFLQPGNRMVAAGFMLYGASTRLVLTTGNGVNVFMLDREIGELVLTHAKVALPDNAATFAINASNERFWEPPVRRYVKECLAGKTGPRGRDFGMRWVASLIAEAYRVLVRGGVFLYPVDARTLQGLAWPYLTHLVLGMTLFLVFPFSRLVHIWSAPVWYLGRRGYQVVRRRRPLSASGRPASRQPAE